MWTVLQEKKKAHRLHDQLGPHQTIRAVLQKLLDGVLVLPGHRSGLTDEQTHRKKIWKIFFNFELILNFQKSCKKQDKNTSVGPSPGPPNGSHWSRLCVPLPLYVCISIYSIYTFFWTTWEQSHFFIPKYSSMYFLRTKPFHYITTVQFPKARHLKMMEYDFLIYRTFSNCTNLHTKFWGVFFWFFSGVKSNPEIFFWVVKTHFQHLLCHPSPFIPHQCHHQSWERWHQTQSCRVSLTSLAEDNGRRRKKSLFCKNIFCNQKKLIMVKEGWGKESAGKFKYL